MSRTINKLCAVCGASFIGAARSKYCPECRVSVKRQQHAEAQRRSRAGTSDKSPRLKNTKNCVVCGSSFESPPSDKTVTCSPDCRSIRARSALAQRRAVDPGVMRTTSESAKKRYIDPVRREAARLSAKLASDAALLIPEGQRGPQNRTSKNWVLIDPDGNHIEVTNLQDWAREYYDFFEPDSDDIDASANRIRCGFQAIACYMRGVPSRTRPVTSYKGWGLYALPTDKED